jgi:hypothetical protein
LQINRQRPSASIRINLTIDRTCEGTPRAELDHQILLKVEVAVNIAGDTAMPENVYRLDRENVLRFPHLPVFAGIGPNQSVTVFVTGNRFWGYFSSLRRDKCFVFMAAPQGFEPRYADPESAVQRAVKAPENPPGNGSTAGAAIMADTVLQLF